jgi:hypothetical protein
MILEEMVNFVHTLKEKYPNDIFDIFSIDKTDQIELRKR